MGWGALGGFWGAVQGDLGGGLLALGLLRHWAACWISRSLLLASSSSTSGPLVCPKKQGFSREMMLGWVGGLWGAFGGLFRVIWGGAYGFRAVKALGSLLDQQLLTVCAQLSAPHPLVRPISGGH